MTMRRRLGRAIADAAWGRLALIAFACAALAYVIWKWRNS